MRTYLIRRILQGIPVLLALSLIIFFIINLAPGDPLAGMMDPNITSEDLARRREQLGLNESIIVRYFQWITNVFKGDLGRSMRIGRRPVAEMIGGIRVGDRLGNTLILSTTSILISWLLAIPIGIFSALRHYSLADHVVTFFVFIGLSLPSFFFALLSIFIFSFKIPIFPIGGLVDPGDPLTFWGVLYHMALPALAMGFMGIAGMTRYTRSSMLEVIKQDYVRTARAKGLSEKIVVYKHAFRNALIPIVTIFGLNIPSFFGGSVIIEQIFTWPGMGTLSITAVFSRDYSVIMAVNMFYAVLTYVGNLIADVLYAVVDPRIRYD